MKKLGFTLIELLITLVLIGILSSIAYPFYGKHLIKVHRTYAIAALRDLAGRMEEYYILKNSYDGATLEALHVNNAHYKNYYDIKPTPNNNTYVLHAIPIGKQADSDSLCGSLTIDQNGNKSISGSGSIEECWHLG